MSQRLRIVGIVFIVFGLVMVSAGFVAYARTADGLDALNAFSSAQNVSLSYNEDGQLVDRGTTEGADAIIGLLADDWGYPIDNNDLDPNDPLVNTATEYMYQMATIGYHVLHGTEEVVLDEAVEYNGETFAAGVHTFEVDGRYWTDFDRRHPIEGPARSQAWSGTVHGLFGELGVGTVTYTSIQMGYALAGLFAGIGLLSILAGTGTLWVLRGKDEDLTMVVPSEPRVSEMV